MTFDDPFTSSDRSAAIRAGDTEREQAAEALRRHHGEGRLSDTEFEARVARCYEARTVGDLDRLFADLPRHDRRLTAPSCGRDLLDRHHPLAMTLAGLVALWLVGGLLSSLAFGWGGHGYPHPFFVPVIAVFVLWRLVVRRTRRRRSAF